MHMVNESRMLFIHLIQHKTLLPAEISQMHVHPACDGPGEVPLRLSRPHQDQFTRRDSGIVEKRPEMRVKLAEVNVFH